MKGSGRFRKNLVGDWKIPPATSVRVVSTVGLWEVEETTGNCDGGKMDTEQ